MKMKMKMRKTVSSSSEDENLLCSLWFSLSQELLLCRTSGLLGCCNMVVTMTTQRADQWLIDTHSVLSEEEPLLPRSPSGRTRAGYSPAEMVWWSSGPGAVWLPSQVEPQCPPGFGSKPTSLCLFLAPLFPPWSDVGLLLESRQSFRTSSQWLCSGSSGPPMVPMETRLWPEDIRPLPWRT